MNAVLEQSQTVQGTIKRGDVWLANLGERHGNIQKGLRPCVVISNNIGNKYAPVVSVVPITSATQKKQLPMHVLLNSVGSGLIKNSIALIEQTTIINKSDLEHQVTTLSDEMMKHINKCLSLQFALS